MNKRTSFLPFAKPDIDKEDIQAVVNALESGWLSKGPKVLEFEEQLQCFFGGRYVVTCNSGTAALHLALLAAGIKEGDEVIVPSFTFASTINVIVHVGATPIFADVQEDTFCIDVQDVVSKLTSRTKAIVAVHYAGLSADIDSLMNVCNQHNLLLIEDAAHAMGAYYKNKPIGTHGHIVCFSFYATKTLSTGEGGALVTDDKQIADQARLLSWHGIESNAWKRYAKAGSWRYELLLPGYKYNMTDPQAALGITQLAKLSAMQSKRAQIAEVYLNRLHSHVQLPHVDSDSGNVHAWHLFPIRIKPDCGISRDDFISSLKDYGIGTSVHFIPVHMQPFYAEWPRLSLPVTELVFSEIVSLPIYSLMTVADAQYVAETINYVCVK